MVIPHSAVFLRTVCYILLHYDLGWMKLICILYTCTWISILKEFTVLL